MKLLETKTFWVGLAAIFAGIGAYYGGEMSFAEMLQTTVLGVLGITGRDAVRKLN